MGDPEDKMRVPERGTTARGGSEAAPQTGTDAEGNPVYGDRSVEVGDDGLGGDDPA